MNRKNVVGGYGLRTDEEESLEWTTQRKIIGLYVTGYQCNVMMRLIFRRNQ